MDNGLGFQFYMFLNKQEMVTNCREDPTIAINCREDLVSFPCMQAKSNLILTYFTFVLLILQPSWLRQGDEAATILLGLKEVFIEKNITSIRPESNHIRHWQHSQPKTLNNKFMDIYSYTILYFLIFSQHRT